MEIEKSLASRSGAHQDLEEERRRGLEKGASEIGRKSGG